LRKSPAWLNRVPRIAANFRAPLARSDGRERRSFPCTDFSGECGHPAAIALIPVAHRFDRVSDGAVIARGLRITLPM
jgi:hypothetical protein